MRLLVLYMLCLISLGLDIAMLVGDGVLYFSYLPAIHGDGVATFSPWWALFFDGLILLCSVFRTPIGIGLVFGVAVATSIDLYPLWKLLETPGPLLLIQTVKISLYWLTALTGAFSHRYLHD